MMYDEAGLDKLFLALNRYCEDYIALRHFADWQNEYGNPVMAIQLHLIADHLSEIGRLTMEARVPIRPAPQEEPTP